MSEFEKLQLAEAELMREITRLRFCDGVRYYRGMRYSRLGLHRLVVKLVLQRSDCLKAMIRWRMIESGIL